MNQLMAKFNIAKDLRNKDKLLSDLFFLCCVKQKVKVLIVSHITEYSPSASRTLDKTAYTCE